MLLPIPINLDRIRLPASSSSRPTVRQVEVRLLDAACAGGNAASAQLLIAVIAHLLLVQESSSHTRVIQRAPSANITPSLLTKRSA